MGVVLLAWVGYGGVGADERGVEGQLTRAHSCRVVSVTPPFILVRLVSTHA